MNALPTSQMRPCRPAACRLLATLVIAGGATLLLFAILLAPVSAQGNDPFVLSWSSIDVENSHGLAWGDYDGDGDLDLVTVGEVSRLYANQDGELAQPHVWSTTGGGRSAAWGDVDGDGDLDLLIGHSGFVRVYRNNDGAMSGSAWSVSASDTTEAAWGDYDGDGDVDVAIARSGGENQLYRNDTTQGSGSSTVTFALVWSSTAISATTSVAWGDVDGDGDLDLAFGNENEANQVYRNDGTWSLLWSSNETDHTSSVAWGDVDGDGRLDLAVGNGGNHVYQANQVYTNTGTTLTAGAVWTSDADTTRTVAWGDYDGDGDLDLIAANDTSRSNSLYRNDSSTLTETPVWSSSEGELSECIAWGDYDGDGDLDLAVGNSLSPNRLYRNMGGTLATTPSWSSDIDYAGEEDTYGVAWGDVDGDGDLDLMVANGTFHNIGGYPNRLFRNDYGTLTTHSVYTSSEADFTNHVAWGDYDGDGDLDLIAANGYYTNYAPLGEPNRLYRNNGGSLTQSAVWSSPGPHDSTQSAAWGDYDGDGDLDLAVANQGQPDRIYRNDTVQGSGSSPTVFTLAWSTESSLDSYSVAWGDYDDDGDLDLAAGTSVQNRVYRNDGGELTTQAVWRSSEWDATIGVAWGDYDGDGDLDLAVTNVSAPSRLYRNDDGLLTESAVWSSIESYHSGVVAWGDYDGDGDLDLAVGSRGQADRVYRNDNGTLTASAAWEASSWGLGVAWGDPDGDGDLDLAMGNSWNIAQPNRLLRNGRDGRALPGAVPLVRVARPGPNADFYSTPDIQSSSSVPIQYKLFHPAGERVRAVHGSYSINGGGDWLPAVAAAGTVTTDLGAGYSYLNSDQPGGPPLQWMNGVGGIDIPLSDEMIAGPLPIGFGFPFYDQVVDEFWISSNGWLALSPQSSASYYNRTLPNRYAPASIIAPFWDDLVPVTDLSWLRYSNPDPSTLLIHYYSMAHYGNASARYTFEVILRSDGSITFQYGNMNGALDSATVGIQNARRNIGTQIAYDEPYLHSTMAVRALPGTDHTYYWDPQASGLFGQSDNVVFRIEAVPAVENRPRAAPGPFLYGAYASQTYPFRVRGTQVRVISDTLPVADAMVYQLPAGQSVGGALIADRTGRPFRTDAHGYLQGRGQLHDGDRLFAMVPVSWTESYTLYYTSGEPNLTGVDAYSVSGGGVHELTVSADNPLYLFDVDVSLEWDAHNDPTYLDQLAFNLQRTSEYLYDFSDGQAALGHINVFQNADNWAYAHVLIHATNRMRPLAAQGGIVISSTEDLEYPDIVYEPGQVHMGAVWNRYGNPGQSLGDDWPIILAHELSHYLFYHDDVYLGLDADGYLVSVDTCTGSAMGDLYSDPNNTEFIADEDHWQDNCSQTLAEQTLHRNEWETMQLWYPALISPTDVMSGPTLMPFGFTDIEPWPPLTATEALDDPTFYLEYEERLVSSSEARAFLMRNGDLNPDDWEYVIDVGSPVGGQNRVIARGAQPGDRLCVFDRPLAHYGCEVIELGDDQLTLEHNAGWNPVIQISPVNSTTLDIQVHGVDPGLPLHARVFPEYGVGSASIALGEHGDVYSGTIVLADASMLGHVQLWVDETEAETDPRREAIVIYAIAGNPGNLRAGGGNLRAGGGNLRAGGGNLRAGGGNLRAGGAPIVSPDGQMIFFTENPEIFQEGQFYTIQSMAGLPALPPGRVVIGQGYSLVATPGTPVITGSVSIQYLTDDILTAGADENGLSIYYHDSITWTELSTIRNPYFNLVTAPSRGPGVYALMSSVQVPLYAQGWNLFAYPIQSTQTVTDALLSISGLYSTVYGYYAEQPDPWRLYHVGGPPYILSLHELEFGRGYWISATQPVTIHLSEAAGGAPVSTADTPPLPPDTFYGLVQGDAAFTPAVGMEVQARIGGALCGQSAVQEYGGDTVYVVHVYADDGGAHAGCGQSGRRIAFYVGGQVMSPTATWDNAQINELNLTPGQAQDIYLPVVLRLY